MNKIINEDYADLIIETELLHLYTNDIEANSIPLTARHSILHLPSRYFDKCSIGTYPYHFFPSCYSLEASLSLEEVGVTRTQSNPNFGLYGQGVLIGIIDTGIEYQNKAFLNADNTSRIVSIWDQTIHHMEPPPVGFTYGAEFDQEELNLALQSKDPLSVIPTSDEIGHGTMLAGIIAGNQDESRNFSGVVPYAEFVIVKLKQAKEVNRNIFSIPSTAVCYQETDILMGVNYVEGISKKLKRPIAICIALGTNEGSHDGHGAMSSYLSFVTQNPKTCVITSGGNEGNSGRHFYSSLNRLNPYKEFELKVGSKDTMFSMEIWQHTPYRIALDITSPTGEYITPIYPRLNECRKFSYIFESSVVWVNNVIMEGDTGDQLIFVRFENAYSGIWKFRVYNIDNASPEFHVWLPSGDFISDDTYFLESNPNTTITSPGNASLIITVTAYNPATGGIAFSSSRGYTRSGEVKPDLAAPGVDLVCPTIHNSYGVLSGSGGAAAITTGVVAMLLEWGILRGNYTSMNGQDIKKLLLRGAKRSNDIEYPNNIWGYGKLNIYDVFERLRY